MVGSEDEWKLLCVVRGYHVYRDVWDPYIFGSQLVLSGSLHRLLDHLLPTFHESERRNNVVFCTSMAEVICQGCYLGCAQHSYKLMCEFCSINLGIA